MREQIYDRRLVGSLVMEEHLGRPRLKRYSLEALESITNVDMEIIDGPPGHVQSLARYPARPTLGTRFVLSEHFSLATLSLDDYRRDGFEYLMVSSAMYERYLDELDRYPDAVAFFEQPESD